MKRLGIVITDGVGYRNFILSDFLEESQKHFEVIIFSCLPKEVYKNLNISCQIIELAVFEENFITWFFRKGKEIFHLRLHSKNNFGMKCNLLASYSKIKNPRGIASRFLYKISKIFAKERFITILNNFQLFTYRFYKINKIYKKSLKDNNLSMLFFTHQRPPFIAPLIYIAKTLKIKTSSFIFSWDNLASKGRMAGNFDSYLVWSDLMKKELQFFYPKTNSQFIKVVGTPQFEPYVLDNYGYSEEMFVKKFKLNNNLPIIFFTCNDASSQNDILYLDMLSKAIKDNKLVKDVNLIVRTSPAENYERYKDIALKYSFIKWNFPDWNLSRKTHQETWSQRVPTIEDISDLKMLLKYCDFNINVLSTITLDSFIFNKPVINPVIGNEINGLFNDQKYLKYGHLEKLVHSSSSIIAKNEFEFIKAVNELLRNVDDKEDMRNDFLKLQIGKPLEGTSKRIVSSLKSFINGF